MSRTAPTAPPPSVGLSGQGKNLALATWAFAMTFWAWNLIGPLAVRYTEQMSLSSSQKALLVATPVLVGAVGRIPVGALTDRYGGRTMFPILTLVTVPFVLLVALA
ncbi:MAG TPA: MFS transporter, partial [Terrabacter sp.]|nr:MFS transporter [Terrabacter sp.]